MGEQGAGDDQNDKHGRCKLENFGLEIRGEAEIGRMVIVSGKNSSVSDGEIAKRGIENAKDDGDRQEALQFAVLRDGNLPRNDKMEGIAQKAANQRPGDENKVVFEKF